ncbi:MAG TPA: response regulator [Moraxellaceae bacterium]
MHRASPHPPHVLIVEDDPMLRRYLEEALQACGYEIHSAGNGEEAAQWLSTHEVDAVLTDVLMPEQDGVKLVAELKRHKPQLPLVAMSGRGRTDLSIDSLSLMKALGADATLEKPFSLNELERTLAFVLTKH